jgi:signal transduction histidine kinase
LTAWTSAMVMPLLNTLLEDGRVTALLADFVQLFPAPTRAWLVDAQGYLVGCHPATAKDENLEELVGALDRVRQNGETTAVPLGVAAPMRLRGQIAGALVVATSQNLDSQQNAGLQLFSRALGLLAEDRLTREELLRKTLHRYRNLSLLNRAFETIAGNLDLSRVNRIILDESARLVQADEGAVILSDGETGKMTVSASRGLDPMLDIGRCIPFGYELAVHVVQTGETEVVEQPDPGARKTPLGAVLCVPLKGNDRVLGVISLARRDLGESFGADDINLINALAGQAAIAIENALMFRDLSGVRAELEEANRHLLEVDQLKSSFLGVVTHELRSPFANITFGLQLFERYGTENWSEEQREQWDQLSESVQNAKRMIDNLVSFAGLLREQGGLNLSDVSFPKLVDDVTEALVPLARPRNIRVIIDRDKQMSPICADERRLSEAVYHLVHNAIKFNRMDGMVRVRYRSDDEKVWFEVRDTGVGIPADKLNLIWDPFSQAADPVQRAIEGLGLGLALVKLVVNAHGGRVGVSSRQGVGSAFSFWVPIAGPEGRVSSAIQQNAQITIDEQTRDHEAARTPAPSNGRTDSTPENTGLAFSEFTSLGGKFDNPQPQFTGVATLTSQHFGRLYEFHAVRQDG